MFYLHTIFDVPKISHCVLFVPIRIHYTLSHLIQYVSSLNACGWSSANHRFHSDWLTIPTYSSSNSRRNCRCVWCLMAILASAERRHTWITQLFHRGVPFTFWEAIEWNCTTSGKIETWLIRLASNQSVALCMLDGKPKEGDNSAPESGQRRDGER